MKYLIIVFALLFVLGLALYLFVFKSYDTMTQLSTIQQNLSQILGVSPDATMTTGDVLPISGQVLVNTNPTGSVQTQNADTIITGSIQVTTDQTTLPANPQILEQVQISDANSISQDPVDQLMGDSQAGQGLSSSQTPSSESALVVETTLAPIQPNTEFEQVQNLVNDLLE